MLVALDYDLENSERAGRHQKPTERVVIRTVGRSGMPGLPIGKTAENILGQLDCAFLAIQSAGFMSPVTTEVGR